MSPKIRYGVCRGINFLTLDTAGNDSVCVGNSSALPEGVLAGDFNRDGNVDVAVAIASPSANSITVLIGAGYGTLRVKALTRGSAFSKNIRELIGVF